MAQALNMFLVLHADHEQNCSTSTVRMVASGGANMAVLDMLEHIHRDGIPVSRYIDQAKDRNSPVTLMGFGHRVYRNFDPRAQILKEAAHDLLQSMHITDPLLDIAQQVEEAALADDYFRQRRLYPNVDFYSGIILRAIGIPVDMFTVMFAIGRTPGWIAHWKEVHDNETQKIQRPRQLYVGEPLTQWVPPAER